MTDIQNILSRLGHPRILVLGDVMLDRYTWGDAERVSPEAPVIVLRADQEEIRPGGAASVAYLLHHLDADVTVAGVIGNDADGRTLRALLRDEGIDDHLLLLDPQRQTTVKHRFVGRASDRHPHQILRVDHETRTPINAQLERDLRTQVLDRLSDWDAVLIPDYLKGVCTEVLLRSVIDGARAIDIPVLIDPGRVSRYERYRGATVLKPNRSEVQSVLGAEFTPGTQSLPALQSLCQSLSFDCLLITLDRDGMLAVTPSQHAEIPTTPRAVYDITGAGDMALAALGLSLASGIDLFHAARFANLAAGKEVERFGIAPVTRAEVAASASVPPDAPRPDTWATKIVNLELATQLSNDYRTAGKRVVFTNGCFDLLHVGHVSYLEEAATLGDVLLVALNSDASVRRLKGPARPIIGEQDRARMLAALGCVHHVLIFEEDTPHNLLGQLRPDVLIKGGTTTDIVGREVVEAYGGRVHRAAVQPGVSTTRIMEELQTRTPKK